MVKGGRGIFHERWYVTLYTCFNKFSYQVHIFNMSLTIKVYQMKRKFIENSVAKN